MLKPKPDSYFMQEALKQAKIAFDEGEVPIGAVITIQERIIARAYNQTERLLDATAHAEMIAITSAANFLSAKYLPECTLYVTLEPCAMCATASYWSQVGRVVYGASDSKRGYGVYNKALIHPKTEILGGILEEESALLIQTFFKRRRNSKLN